MIHENIGFSPTAVGNGGGFGTGFGGGGLIEGLLIASLLGRRGLGGDGDGCGKEAAVLAAISNGKDATVAEGRGVLASIANSKDTTVAEGRSLAAAICEAEKTNLQQFYAAAIQASNNTQAIKDQATAFAIVADKRFDDLASAGVNQTAAILAKINQTEIDALRDQLAHSHRHADKQGIEIAINNSNAQAQAQFQAQNSALDRKFDALFGSFNQLNRNTQDVINFGTMAASANQANQQTNVK